MATRFIDLYSEGNKIVQVVFNSRTTLDEIRRKIKERGLQKRVFVVSESCPLVINHKLQLSDGRNLYGYPLEKIDIQGDIYYQFNPFAEVRGGLSSTKKISGPTTQREQIVSSIHSTSMISKSFYDY